MSTATLVSLDPWQASLFGLDDPEVDPLFRGVERIWLDDDSWIDLLPGWLRGADLVFAEIVSRVEWSQRDVVMYDRVLAEPRLTAWWSADSGASEPLSILGEIRGLLSSYYGRSFRSIGCNYYRDGNDSVAWHGDQVRLRIADPLVAIVSVGTPRPFQIRRRGGGPRVQFQLGQGDLFVMGGSCQHDWEHCVPKVARAGPRISLTYREV
jgi:alkylated DNA repair dioxygenase AlkB